LEDEPGADASDTCRRDTRDSSELRAGLIVHRGHAAGVERTEYLERELESTSLSHHEALRRFERDDLKRRRAQIAELAHATRAGSLTQDRRRGREHLGPHARLPRLRPVRH